MLNTVKELANKTISTHTNRLLHHCIYRVLFQQIQSCFLLPSVYIWAEPSQLSGKMGIKQIIVTDSASSSFSIQQSGHATLSCINWMALCKTNHTTGKAYVCAAGVYNLRVTNIIRSITLRGSCLFVCRNSSEAFKGVTFALSSTSVHYFRILSCHLDFNFIL